MIEAVFTQWDKSQLVGTAMSSDGQTYRLGYSAGQSFTFDETHQTPKLSGHHDQAPGYQLKYPEVGDAVLVQLSRSNHAEPYWGYLRHYLELVERRYGTRFIAAIG